MTHEFLIFIQKYRKELKSLNNEIKELEESNNNPMLLENKIKSRDSLKTKLELTLLYEAQVDRYNFILRLIDKLSDLSVEEKEKAEKEIIDKTKSTINSIKSNKKH